MKYYLLLPLFLSSVEAIGQIQMQVDHQGKFAKVVMVNQTRMTVEDEKGRSVRGEFTKTRFIEVDEYKEGFIEVAYGKQEQLDIEKSNTSKMNKNLFEMEAFITADRTLERCFYLLVFSSNGAMANYYNSLGTLKKGLKTRLKIKMPAHVDQIGSIHVFSRGDEVKTNQSVPGRSLRKEFEEISKETVGAPITVLYYKNKDYPHKLSPDGAHFATIRDKKTHYDLSIVHTESLSITHNVSVGDYKENTSAIEWLSNDLVLYIHDGNLLSFDLTSGEQKTVKKDVYRIFMNLRDNKHIVVGRRTGLFRLDCFTGKVTPVSTSNVGSTHWIDFQGNYRLRSIRNGPKVKYEYRTTPKSKWVSLDQICNEEGLRFAYKSDELLDQKVFIDDFAMDPDKLIIYSKHKTDTLAIYEYNLRTGLIDKEIYHDSTFDLGGPQVTDARLLYSNKNEILGLTYWRDKQHVQWFSERFKDIQKQIDHALPDTCNIPIEWTDDGSVILYNSFNEKHPGIYYLLNLKKGKVQSILNLKPKLQNHNLANCEPLRFQARDSQEIQGYLTLPDRNDSSEPLPLIVMPHGGPTVRDYWRYNPIIQFLSTRGYAVLQVNYRGSAGFGEVHTNKGLIGNIDTIPIDDIADGTKHLIEMGIADKERICVMGSSWGGYSTYMCMIRYPELYKCGVAFAAPSHMAKMLSHDSYVGNRYGLAFWKRLLKESSDDEQYINKVSPINHVEKVQGPILIIHGEYDWRVSVEQAKIMKNALIKAGKECSLIILPQSGHGWSETDMNHYLNETEEFISGVLNNL